ncbi:NAD(P)/FAD-dependent oxidoreductase [Actinoplanes couchii]|uniref:FAD-binding monooxygenase n=1 Tax=Actinoplanes couchii TaxID=403638 RepID=A0ABQ3X3R4_9ACTN|nr:FAD-dependent monooxygenase [Actinoplanes couchii]MDR6322911.1 2-polyprenyl-6-methoxyphenol hydroxylase-like FAD-dependent oxidoreductase [Actinoplanes couchii]GID53151.1 FAD-binding monooxygenase [Actinoplanes couchii]
MGCVVVVGASVGGLLVARALSERFERVVVLDRDRLPVSAEARRGVPQSRQAHVLLAKGGAVLGEMFPGFAAEMVAAGVPVGDAHADCRWYLDGHRMRQAPSPLPCYGVSRPLLEHLVRRRVRALPNVEITDDTEVTGLLHDRRNGGTGRVCGVRVRRGGVDGEIPADLVVDAGGRGSRMPVWLRELGYGEVPSSTVRTGLVYTSRHYRWVPDDAGFAVVMAPYPGMPRTGILVRQDGDRVVLLLAGMLGAEPPMDDAGVRAFAESLPGPEIRDFLRTAEPIDEPVRMRYPSSVRHRYERMTRRPGGFVAVGDALCSFNPIYGQGMTVTALQARLLAGGTDRYFARAARLLAGPWSLATGSDLRFPEVKGRRGLLDRPLHGYLSRLRAAARRDAALGAAFLRVSNMLEDPAHLLTPRIMLRVLRGGR